ncbi:uracil phosphoribosyltransferase [Bacilli bacterium]|nr:uracil phosphoribosyltransferase [Bacilli bacterium]
MEPINLGTKVLDHPVILHHLAIIRDKYTDSNRFRDSIKKISEFLFYDATENLPTRTVEIETPLCKTEGYMLTDDGNVFVSTIMRAGIIMLEAAANIIPNAIFQHLGMYRDESTCKPVWYYNRLPDKFKDPENIILYICDPMLATGGTACEAIKLYKNKGIGEENITFLSVISAPTGMEKIRDNFPDVRMITASLDSHLNEKGYIVPGLGDAGDRIFNTLY